MKRERDLKVYQKLLEIFQWYKYDRLYTLKTGINREHLWANMWDAQHLYKGWLFGFTIQRYKNLLKNHII